MKSSSSKALRQSCFRVHFRKAPPLSCHRLFCSAKETTAWRRHFWAFGVWLSSFKIDINRRLPLRHAAQHEVNTQYAMSYCLFNIKSLTLEGSVWAMGKFNLLKAAGHYYVFVFSFSTRYRHPIHTEVMACGDKRQMLTDLSGSPWFRFATTWVGLPHRHPFCY